MFVRSDKRQSDKRSPTRALGVNEDSVASGYHKDTAYLTENKGKFIQRTWCSRDKRWGGLVGWTLEDEVIRMTGRLKKPTSSL